ncbi:MAG: ferrous iron transport protein A [Clostridia bacterium]|nr:ferrous iron transport protein A [Clostridia bacterium]
MDTLTLDNLSVNRCGRVAGLLSGGAMRRRMIDLGIVEGTKIECVGRSPSGDPSAYMIRGAVIAIRKRDAKNILLVASSVGGNYGTH